MRDKADRPAAPSSRVANVASYGLVIGAVLLAWQMVIQPFVQRAPVEAAIRLAPGSPLVLRRAAESELTAGRVENAAALSRDALARSPFDARALRVVGLTEARAGRDDEADEMLTLAGNWSLRDDPTHAWLVERRLRSGNYASAFAHADTLVRRREDIQPQVFRLFTVAGVEDPQRSLGVLANLLSTRPPWRGAFISTLNQTPEELQLFAGLAILLEACPSPLNNTELRFLYLTLLDNRQFEAIRTVRERINRPPPGIAVTNGGFADASAPDPFQWQFIPKAGIRAEIVDDDIRASNQALRVDYDGYASGTVTEQLTSLTPGAYRFTAEVRTETGDPNARLAWTLTCAADGRALATVPAGASGVAQGGWTNLSAQVEVPGSCPAQWLRLETRAGDRKNPTIAWFDRITLSPIS